mgnify:FL=1
MNKNSKIYIAGHTGLVGSSIVENLLEKGYKNLIYRTHKELNLMDQVAVRDFFITHMPDIVILAAAKVGGIEANNIFRADFIYDNLVIQNNVIHQAYLNKVEKLLFLGSTCVYPKNTSQPIKEDMLLTSELEYTNEPYAIAKIAGLKMCESYNLQYGTNFISVMPTNLYGPNDNFDLETAHVLPALIRKFYLAKLLKNRDINLLLDDLKSTDINKAEEYLSKFGIYENRVEIWGSGTPRREFLYSKDMADACVFLLENINFSDLINDQKEIRNTHINIGTGSDITIKELALLIKDIVDFKGEIYFNTTKPDGTMLKLSDTSKLNNLGWRYKTNIYDGIQNLYEWYTAKKLC